MDTGSTTPTCFTIPVGHAVSVVPAMATPPLGILSYSNVHRIVGMDSLDCHSSAMMAILLMGMGARLRVRNRDSMCAIL